MLKQGTSSGGGSMSKFGIAAHNRTSPIHRQRIAIRGRNPQVARSGPPDTDASPATRGAPPEGDETIARARTPTSDAETPRRTLPVPKVPVGPLGRAGNRPGARKRADSGPVPGRRRTPHVQLRATIVAGLDSRRAPALYTPATG